MTIAELTTQSSTPVTTQATGTAPTTAASSAFAQTMQSAVQALTSSDLLLQRPVSGLEKPGMKDFMDATGVDAETAAELLTGIMGSNQDYRNWKTIMASSDPLQAARQATAAQYSSDLPYATADNKTIPDQKSVVAKTSNLEVIDYGELAPPAVYLTDKQGMLLRWLQPDSESITTNLDNLGFDTNQTTDLVSQLLATGKPLLSELQISATSAATTQSVIGTDVAVLLQATAAIPISSPQSVSNSTASTPTTAQALTSSDLLLQRPVSGLEKPGMKDFMDATGVDAETAAELLTGIMGSNQDYRNWKTIMASSDPLQAARQATAAQYSSDLPYATADNKTIPDQKSVVAKTSNLEVIDYGELAPPAVYLTDKQGMLLRWLQPDSESIMAGLTNFGFDTSQINDLAVQLKALKNVEIEQQVALT